MRNKLKRSKTCNDASYPSKDQLWTAEVIELSDSSCSNDETSPPAKDAHGSGGKPLQEQSRHFKIAPIFLHTAQLSKSKRSRNEKLQKSVLPQQSEDVQQLKSQQQQLSGVSHLTQRCRGQLSPSALDRYLEEIQASNSAFSVRAVFSTLQKKASLQDFGSPGSSLSPQQSHLKGKRKHGNGSSERVPKRIRSDLGHCHISARGVQGSTILPIKKQPRSNKLSRTHRLRQQSGSLAGLENCCEPYPGSTNHTESYQRDSSFEDILWTDKYSPQHSSEVIGNSASVNKLQSWLKKWKKRADCDERRRMEERKWQENSNDSWDCGDFQGEAGAKDDREEPLCNTMLITGPPGVGKTAAVYACSQELGFKVFEVNCSSQRSGRNVLSQLKEATQSHLVEISGKDPLKPSYFNNYSCSPKSETLPGKTVPLKNVTSTSKKRAAQNIGRSSRKGKANPATVTLAHYFKMKAKADHLHFSGLSPSEKLDSKPSGSPSPGSDPTVPQNKNTATSLILFEEVDVIFDDDAGFLAAIKTFMATTKRPVVLTTNDPSFKERFRCSLEEILFKTPLAVDVCSYLQLVALAENVRWELDDARSLLCLFRGDVRRCLLQLQLWVHSGGGQVAGSGGLPKKLIDVQHLSVTERGDNADSNLPQCDTGCTASMLGLHPVTQNQLINLLKCESWLDKDMTKLLRLLAESWRRGVPLLYSNLELLLPIRAKEASVRSLDIGPCSGQQNELAPPDLHIQQLDGNISPKASANNRQCARNMSRLSRRKYNSSKQNPQRTLSSERALSRTPHSKHKTEQNAAKVSTDCLDALSDFFDLMSYLDATVPNAAPLVSGPCCPEAFVWTGAEMKDGLLDEMSEEEERRSWSQERLMDIKAAVEGLGCHRCLCRASEARTEAQKYTQERGDARWERLEERLTLPASSKEKSLSLVSQPLCAPSVSQTRYELSRTVLGSNSFSLLGNRQAVSADYMPVLRHICRFQREQRQKEEPVRCPNYLSSKHLGLTKSTIQLLEEDFS